jgi:multiple sugar transport system substrate-binding protein
MPPISAAPRERQRRALCARERSQRVTPNDLSREHAALVKAAADGKLSRRQLMVRGMALGLSATALAGLMSAYRSPAAVAQDNPLAGQTIDMTILGIAGWPPSRLGVDMANELFKPYAQETYGYEVNFSFEEAPFDALFQKAATSLQSGSAQYNIIISDSQWLGALAEPGWIVRLNDIIAENPDLDIQFEEAAAIGYRIYPDGSDNIYGFPQEGDTIALFVRQDLMSDQAERDSYTAANDGEDLPQSYDEWLEVDIDRYERICQHFTRPDEDLYGTALQWSKVYDFVSCYAYPFMFSNGGEAWDPATGQVEGIANSEINIAGLEHNKRFLQYAPPGATNYGIAEEVDVFTAGNLATCWQWSALGPQMLNQLVGGEPGEVADADRPITPEMVLITVPPGFPQEDGTLNRIYTLGGQPWVLNAFNDEAHQQVAIDFMKFWYLPETQLEFSRRGGNSAVTAVLEDPGYEDLQPHFRAYKYMIRENRSKDFWHDPNYAEMLAVQQEAWNGYISDVVPDAKLALDYTACQQQEILFDAGRTDIEPSEACADISI